MENPGSKRTSILTELSGGNVELGKAFALELNNMVVQSGLRNPKAVDFDVMMPSWKKLADKKDKTKEENDRLTEQLCSEIRDLAKSYLLFMAKETGNLTGKLDFVQYEIYMMKYRFGHYDVMNKPEYLAEIKPKIKTAFEKIISHGEEKLPAERLIDKECMADYLCALMIKSNRDENDKFNGFKINGSIEPREYVVNEHFLFEEGDNMFSVKLRIAHKMLNNLF